MSDVQGASVTSTGTVIDASVRVKAVQYRGSGTATGTIVLRDGGSGGTVRLTIYLDDTDGMDSLSWAPDYIQFNTDVHATLTNATGLTVLYH